MGGRGASSGASGSSAGSSAGSSGGAPASPQIVKYGGGGPLGGHQNLQSLVTAMRNSIASSTGQGGNGSGRDTFHAGEGNSTPDFTDNNNPSLVKWQQQNDDTKTAKYLSKLGKSQTPSQDAEGNAYHQSAFQNMVIDQNLNAPVYARMSAKNFDAYCKANNLTPIYRGWGSGKASRDRFENSAFSHTGTGMYGEGFYFGDKSTATSYSRGAMTVAALSPNARVVDLSKVQTAISNSGASRAFRNSGRSTTGYYSKNIGEAQMALKMGYNVIRTSWSYVVLTRDAVVIRK